MLAEPITSPVDDYPADDDAAEQDEAIDLRMPAWLVSGLFHVLVILVLPLLDLPPLRHRPVAHLEAASVTADNRGEEPITEVVLSLTLPDAPVATVAEQFAAKLANPTAAGGRSSGEPEMEVELTQLTAVDEPILAIHPVLDTVTGPSQFDPAGTQNATAARTDLMLLAPDQRLIQVPLLTPEDMTGKVASSEESVALATALRWLVFQQGRTGWWNDGELHQANSRISHLTSRTSLAMLALLSVGQTHQSGKYQEPMAAATNRLLETTNSPVDRDAEAQRALALCELFLATRDPRLRQAAQDAISGVLDTNYRPVMNNFNRPPDRTWAWQVLALYAAERAGLQDNTNVMPTMLGNATSYFAWTPRNFTFRPLRAQASERPAPSANNALSLAYSIFDLRDSLLNSAATDLAALGPALQGERPREDDYLTTLLLHRLNHPTSSGWQKKITQHLLNSQIKAGFDQGSWRPEHDKEWDLTTTTFSILILTIPGETTVIHKRPGAFAK